MFGVNGVENIKNAFIRNFPAPQYPFFTLHFARSIDEGVVDLTHLSDA
jgi:hypothetical protein